MTSEISGSTVPETVSADAGDVQALSARLSRARRRRAAEGLLQAAAYALAVALGVFCLTSLGNVWLGLDLGYFMLAAPAAGVGASVLLVGAVLVLSRLPSPTAFARSADRVLGTQERISTALEVAATPNRVWTPVSRALVADAANRAASVEPRRLTPWRLPKATLAIVLLAVLSGVLVAMPQPENGGAGGGLAPDDAVTAQAIEEALQDDEREELAADLRELAAQIEEEAQQAGGDLLLVAIARDLQQLADDVESGEIADRDALLQQLDRLLEVAADVPFADQPGVGENEFSRRLEGVRDQAASPPGAQGGSEQASSPAAVGAGEDAAENSENTTEGNDTDESAADEASAEHGPNIVIVEENDSFVPEAPVADDPACLPYGSCDDFPEDGAGEEAQSDGRDLDGLLPGGAPNGAAGAAQGGGTAGGGTLPLGGGPGWSELEFGIGAELLLPDLRIGDGHRIRMDAAPELGEYVLDVGVPIDGNWTQELTSGDVGRTLLPPREREVVTRYFYRAPSENGP